jgi:hypothetical protein
VDAGVLELEVVVPGGSRGKAWEAGFAILGSFAESNTHVVETRREEGRSTLEITTGCSTATRGSLRTATSCD